MTKTSTRKTPPAIAATSALQQQLQQILALATSHKLAGDPEHARSFIAQCFQSLPAPEVEAMAPHHAAKQAADAWEFMQQRTDESKLVVTPLLNEEGQASAIRILTLNPDMPFLVDSMLLILQRAGYTTLHCLHPMLLVRRDSKGYLKNLRPFGKVEEAEKADGWQPESMIAIDIPASGSEGDVASLTALLRQTLKEVHATVEDWPAMLQCNEETIAQCHALPDIFGDSQLTETIHFLRWLADGHFIFMGVQDYSLQKESLQPERGSALGLYRLERFGEPPLESEEPLVTSLHFLTDRELVEVSKADQRSNVHRPVHLDVIGVKRFDKEGTLLGERRFIGLFTSLAYFKLAKDIPFLRRKIARVKEQSGFALISHNGKALATILEQMPRDELFQMTPQELYDTAMGVLALESRPHTQVFVRHDPYGRFVSCLLYVPKERFSTQMRERLQEILEEAYHGQVSAHYTQVTDSPLARLHVLIRTTPGKIPAVDLAALNRSLNDAVNAWDDQLKQILDKHYDTLEASRLFRLYHHAFSDIYRSRYKPEQALIDLPYLEAAIAGQQLQVNLETDTISDSDFHIRIYNPGEKLALSDILPILEHFGLYVQEERPSEIMPVHYKSGVKLRDFRVQLPGSERPDLGMLKSRFEAALLAVWNQKADNDGFNQLVLRAGLEWSQVLVLRFYGKYLKQIRFPFEQLRMEEALATYPALARKLVALFEARFDPAQRNDKRAKQLQDEIEKDLNAVSNSAHDRIIRRYRALILASLRTNHYQKDAEGQSKPYLSVKFDPEAIPDMPLPRPYREIYVFGTRTAGVHLRGGKVARGGLRWSDRHEDFRTEILGLMKAQMVKNTVIVPEGAKGGFIVRRPPVEGGREAYLAEGIECYKLFLRGLLDITDNIVGGQVVKPEQVICHDEDDPYLVVAADKGTATFSDIANSVSLDYGFWLDDAFASGGSVGYDHKGMGITARGAWVSVARHFMEMGVDIQAEDFTVVGIGDMAGDVFGNGMLLSPHIRLVAAFNHMHIFLDPNPDAAKSFHERQRLFNLPRSSWADYDAKLISEGGGVFERSAKTIALSPHVQAMLQIAEAELRPEELIQAILKAPVDLLWNGGIGTYVKAASESHEDVGDHANTPLRVNGRDLRCKVVGEGGNLGFTQRGRIEYAQRGGRINTDAIDNSAGVDTSDHEVNIKIAFARAMENGLTRDERNERLAAMTDDVAQLVLRDNRLQTQALTIAEHQGVSLLETQARLMRQLEKRKLLNRDIEYLPTDDEIANRLLHGQGLTRPESATLLSYSKMALYRELLDSNLPDNPYFDVDLRRYFPQAMLEGFERELMQHPLRRELIATAVTNSIINRMGATYFYQATEDTGMLPCDIARAYVAARDGFGLRSLWNQIEALNGQVAVATQLAMFQTVSDLIYHTSIWFLRNLEQPLDVAAIIAEYQPHLNRLEKLVPPLLTGESRQQFLQRQQQLQAAGVPESLACDIASLPLMVSACDIARVAITRQLDVANVAETYYQLQESLRFNWLAERILQLPTADFWSRQAVGALFTDLLDQLRRLTQTVLKDTCAKRATCTSHWLEQHQHLVDRYQLFLDDLASNEALDISILVVALRKIQAIFPVE